ncbi:VirB4 family type IV secretion system protein [Spiroplasma endosymbiont of Aspidapion aeneum]|uniref:VirB4 family type IV secretion system protein n=1 Tax=Spiroplasma endosymbiont of Aspidapion aeneum TaxID=3066276 RepID=UPI00313B880C
MFNKKRSRLKINNYLTLVDFICLICFICISSLLFVLLKNKNTFIAILVSLFTMSTLSCGLIKYNERSLYYHIFVIFKYITHLLKKSKNNLKILTSDNINVLANKTKDGISYMCCYKIDGYNILSKNFEEQQQAINILKKFLEEIDNHFYIIKVDEKISFIDNSHYLNNSGKNGGEFAKNFIKNVLKNQNSNEGQINNNAIGFAYYIVICFNKIDEFEMLNSQISSKLMGNNLKANIIDKYKFVNLIKNIHDPSASDYDRKTIDTFEQSLISLFEYQEYKIKSNYIKSGGLYINFNTIDSIELNTPTCWLWPFIISDTNLIMSCRKTNKNQIEKNLNNRLLNLKTSLTMLSQKNQTEIAKLEQDIIECSELIKSVSLNQEKILSTNLIFINYGTSIDELNNKKYILNDICKSNNMKFNSLQFKQQEAFRFMKLANLRASLSNEKILLTSTMLSNSFPFIESQLLDEKGCYLGREECGKTPIIFDQFVKTENRRNHNMIVFGSSGNGKTTFVKKLVTFHCATNKNIIILDPENEYSNLCKKFDGSIIDINKSSRSGIINPFQIWHTYTEEEYDNILDTNKKLIASQINIIEEWIKILYPEMNLRTLLIFKNMVAFLYNNINFKINVFDSIKPNEWPTFIKLYEIMKKYKVHYQDNEEFITLLDIIESDFTKDKKYYYIFSLPSSLSTLDNSFTNVSTLGMYESYGTNTLNAIIYLLINYIYNQIKRSRINTNKQTIFVIDESYLFTDSKNPIILNFIYQLTKRIRKYNSGIILITQNLNDFLGDESIKKQTTGLLNNIQYTSIFNLQPDDMNNLINLYKNTNPITQNECEKILNFKMGQMLLINNGLERVFMNVDLLDIERKELL